MSNIWICIVSHVCLAVQPMVSLAKSLTLNIIHKTAQSHSVICAVLMNTMGAVLCIFTDFNFGLGLQGQLKAKL